MIPMGLIVLEAASAVSFQPDLSRPLSQETRAMGHLTLPLTALH